MSEEDLVTRLHKRAEIRRQIPGRKSVEEGKPDRLADLLDEAAQELSEFEAVFDLRWQADMRAIKRWQKEHPGHDLIWPDHVDLVVWLMEQLDGMRKVMDGHDAA